MDFFENGSSPENGDRNDKPINPDINRDGGVFAEKDYSAESRQEREQAAGVPAGNYQSYGQNAASFSADSAYRQMYSQGGAAPDRGGYYTSPTGAEVPAADIPYPDKSGYADKSEYADKSGNGQTGGHAYTYSPASSEGSGGGVPPYNGGYYYEPKIGAMPAPGDGIQKKKGSGVWVAVVAVIILFLFSAVMFLIAFSHKNEGADISVSASDGVSGGSSGSGVTVNINVAPKPLEDDSLYQNKETGLMTPAGAANSVLPSIVNLYGYKGTTLQPYNEASGIIISEDGYIITNAHATEDVERFKAKLNDEREFEAVLIGADSRTDLAVLKIEAEDIVPAVIGSSSDMIQGEEVIAIGNAGGFNDTVTVGNVSYVDREIQSYTGYPIKCIQTDAALNFGNSGGALVNLYGQVIGVVVSKYSSTGSENIGFAISSDFAVPVIEDLMEKGYVTGRARIGIMYNFISPDTAENMGVKPGLLVAEISEDCDVYNTELQPDDIITEIDGIQMITENSVKEFQNTHKAGDVVTAKVYRLGFNGGEEEFEITFKLEEQQ